MPKSRFFYHEGVRRLTGHSYRHTTLRSATSGMSENAFTLLFTSQVSQIKRLFKRRGTHPQDAADLAQEAFYRLLRAQSTTQIEEPQHYLKVIVNNLLKEQYYAKGRRRNWVRQSLDEALQEAPPQLSVEIAFDARIDRTLQERRLAKALQLIATEDRELLAWHYLEGLSLEAIAQRQGRSKNAVYKALVRAMQRCRKQMDEADEGTGV